MKSTVTGIFWERILLHFELKCEAADGPKAVYLEEERTGRRYRLREVRERSAETQALRRYYVNVTNPGNCRCLPDGRYSVMVRGKKDAAMPAEASCDLKGTGRRFPFHSMKDCCVFRFDAPPLCLEVRTVCTDRRAQLHRAFTRLSVNALYRMQHPAYHLLHGKGRRVLFLSGQSETPGGNLTAVRDRMRGRGLTEGGGFEILESYRDRSSGRGGMLRAVRAIAAADYVFLDDNEPLLDYLIPDKRTVLTQLWHAGVGFKSSGYSRWGCQGAPAPFSCHRQYTWGIVSSKAVIPIFSEIWGINDDQVLPLGIPRIDRFLDPGHRAEAERIAEERYPLIRGKRVILFAPTYRGKGKTDASYPYERIDFDLLYETAGEDSVVLFHMHPWTRERVPIPERMKDRMADTADTADINDLFYVTDVLITDYSSNICEFSLMGKPMLFYGFDEREYAAERGFHRDYETFAPGKVCRTFAELAEALRTGDFEQEKQERYVREQFERRDCGASDRVIDRILLGR